MRAWWGTAWSVWLLLGACVEPAPDGGNDEAPITLGDDECFVSSDCAVGEHCYDVGCLREPACRDQRREGECSRSCVGQCADPSDDIYCDTDDDCGDERPSCRHDDRLRVDDPRTPEKDNSGWCAGGCFQVVIAVVSPEDGLCYVYPDSCHPPGYPQVTDGRFCISLR